MRLDLADLRLFLHVLESGSITAGARRANLALASASERLRNMERQAGVTLLQRRPRGIAPTEAGEAVAHHARLILGQQARLHSELHDFASGARGTLHLYANTAALTDYLPPLLAPWLAERPGLHLDLKERTSSEIVALVGNGLAEAGIISDAVAAPGLRVDPIAADHLVAILPVTHHLAQCRTLRLADLYDEPLVGLAPGNALQEHLAEQASRDGRSLDLRIRMKTFEGLCQMVAHGIGPAIVPRGIANRYRRRHGYRTLPLDEGWARRRLCLCYGPWAGLSAAMRSLLLHLGATPEAAGHAALPTP